MPIITDKQFGRITVRKSTRARHVRFRVGPDGQLKISLPLYTPVFFLKRLINSSRDEIADLLEKANPVQIYTHGQQIGKSHKLMIRQGSNFSVVRHRTEIVVTANSPQQITSEKAQQQIRQSVIAALKIEAKSYLPKRLAYLAEQHGFSYEKVRFSHAGSRWGSCSTSGTISLNIALMKLPFEQIDYVLIHELVHTREMNHSKRFWEIVCQADPNYLLHRKALKAQQPTV